MTGCDSGFKRIALAAMVFIEYGKAIDKAGGPVRNLLWKSRPGRWWSSEGSRGKGEAYIDSGYIS